MAKEALCEPVIHSQAEKKCAAVNLSPILSDALNTYSNDVTNKFEILLSLGQRNEELLEKFDDQVSKDFWTRVALLAIANIISSKSSSNWAQDSPALISSAVLAFKNFLWKIN